MARKLKGQGQVLSGSPSSSFTNFSPKPIQSLRSPTTADTGYEIGQLWCDTTIDSIYGLVDVAGGIAQWNLLGDSGGDISSLTTDSGIATPAGGTITIAGTADQIATSATGSTITLSLEGPYTPATYTDHGVLVGSGASDITALAVGTNGQVLTGNTGADPSFEAIGTLSGLADGGVILGGGAGPFTATALGTAGQVLTSNGAGVDPTFQTPGGGTTADYADFFALMPGDNAATIAVGAAILLPQDGPSSGTSITRLSSSTFNLADIATYSISFQCSFDEAGQMMVSLNGSELAPTVSGRATGTNQIYISCLVTTTVINSVLSIVNPSGNAAALTITPIAGGTHAVSAHLVIQRVAGGPGGGLLNTINSAVPIGGDFIIEGTANQVLVTTPGSVANSSAISLIGPYTPTTYTTDGVLVGDGSSSIVATAAGTDGQVLIGATGAAPAFGTVTSTGGSISFTLGVNTLNLEATNPGLATVETAVSVPTMTANTVYVCTNGASTITLGIPTTGVVGQIFGAVSAGNDVASRFQFTQGAGVTVHDVAASNTTGATGTTTSNEQYTSAYLQVTEAPAGTITDLVVVYGRGTLILA